MDNIVYQLGTVVSSINMTRRIMNDLKETRTFMDEERLYLMQMESTHQSRLQLLRRREDMLRNTLSNTMPGFSGKEIREAVDKAILKATNDTAMESNLRSLNHLGPHETGGKAPRMDVNALEGIIKDIVTTLRIPGYSMLVASAHAKNKKKKDATGEFTALEESSGGAGPELKKQRKEKKAAAAAGETKTMETVPPPTYEEAAASVNKIGSIEPNADKQLRFQLEQARDGAAAAPSMTSSENVIMEEVEEYAAAADEEIKILSVIEKEKGKGGARRVVMDAPEAGPSGIRVTVDAPEAGPSGIQRGQGAIPKKVAASAPKMRHPSSEETFPEVVLEDHDFSDIDDESFASIEISKLMKRREAASDIGEESENEEKKDDGKDGGKDGGKEDGKGGGKA